MLPRHLHLDRTVDLLLPGKLLDVLDIQHVVRHDAGVRAKPKAQCALPGRSAAQCSARLPTEKASVDLNFLTQCKYSTSVAGAPALAVPV